MRWHRPNREPVEEIRLDQLFDYSTCVDTETKAFFALQGHHCPVALASGNFSAGPLSASVLPQHCLIRHGDRVFTVVRDPVSIIISQVNYILARVIDDRERNLPDTREWLKMMNMESIPDNVPMGTISARSAGKVAKQNAIKDSICTIWERYDFALQKMRRANRDHR